MYGNADSEIRDIFACGIRNLENLSCGIENSGLCNLEYSSRNPESTVWNPESKTFLNFLTYGEMEKWRCELTSNS